MVNVDQVAEALSSGPAKPPKFGDSWVEVVAMEYAKSRAGEADSAAQFAQTYLDALSEIRAWLRDGRPRL